MGKPVMRLAGDGQRALPRRFPFTIKRLEALKVPAGQRYLMVYDTEAPRLAYVLQASGSSAFYYYGRMAGRPRRYRIGDGSISIEDARQTAREVLTEVGKGHDVSAQRRISKKEITFGEAFAWFIEHHAKRKKRTWREDEQRHDQYLKSLDSYKLTAITGDQLAELNARIGKKHPRVANRVMALVSSVFGRTKKRDGFRSLDNPASTVERFEEFPRDRALQATELPRFFAGLNELSTDMADFFRLALFTGARSSNVRSMEWKELSLPDAWWLIPKAKFKGKRDLMVPLVPAAIEVLERRRAALPRNARYVFPAESKDGFLVEPKNAWKRLCRIADLKSIRIHDLRRTLATFQNDAEGGGNLAAISKSLGHADIKTTMRYVSTAMGPVRASVAGAVDAMLATQQIAKETKPSTEAEKKD